MRKILLTLLLVVNGCLFVQAQAPAWITSHPVSDKEYVGIALSRVRLLATSWTAAYQAPPSMGFSRQEYWSGVPLPSPGDLPDPGIEPTSVSGIAGRFFTDGATSEAL